MPPVDVPPAEMAPPEVLPAEVLPLDEPLVELIPPVAMGGTALRQQAEATSRVSGSSGRKGA